MQKFKVSRTTQLYMTSVIIILCSLGLSSQKALALLTSSASPPLLTKTSEIIVRGRIIAIEGDPRKEETANIQVDRVIKGKWNGKPLYFTLPDAPLPLINWLVVGEYGLFFLKSVNGKNVPVDPFHIMLPVREGMPPSEESQEPLSSIRDELLFTALGHSGLSKESKYKQQEFGSSFTKMFPMLPMNVKAVKYLAEPTYGDYHNVIPSHEREAKALRTLLSTDNSPTLLRGAVLATLLTFGQFDVLDKAVEYVDAVQQMAASPTRAQLSVQANDVAMAIRYVNGVKYIPALGNLLQNDNVEVRRSAISSLETFVYQSTPFDKPMTILRDSVTLPFLIEALDDNDSQVRHRALRALPRATNKPSWNPPYLPTGKLDLTIEEEQKLIAQWKQWWKNEGSKAFDATLTTP